MSLVHNEFHREGAVGTYLYYNPPNPLRRFSGIDKDIVHFGRYGKFSRRPRCAESRPEVESQPGRVKSHLGGLLLLSHRSTFLY
jgi:hypothetical protein